MGNACDVYILVDVTLIASKKPTCQNMLGIGRGGHFRYRFGASSPPKYKRKESERELRPDSVWWERVDSNHRSRRQQIYSLPPLATREHSLIPFMFAEKQWSWWTDSNPRPADYKSAALPAELHQQTAYII